MGTVEAVDPDLPVPSQRGFPDWWPNQQSCGPSPGTPVAAWCLRSAAELWVLQRIIEWLELKGTSKTILFQPPAMRRVANHYIIHQLRPIQPGLECLQGWGIHSSSGQLCQRLTALSVRKFPNILSKSPLLKLKTYAASTKYEYLWILNYL